MTPEPLADIREVVAAGDHAAQRALGAHVVVAPIKLVRAGERLIQRVGRGVSPISVGGPPGA